MGGSTIRRTRPLGSLALLVVVVSFLLGACGSESVAGDPEAGRLLFETPMEEIIFRDSCATCHTLDGVDGEFAPSLAGISERAGSRVDEMSAVEYLRESILVPGAFRVDGWLQIMSTQYGNFLTESEIDDLVAFLLTQ